MAASQPNIVIVTRETRLSGLKKRYVSGGMIQFQLARAHAIEVERRRAQGEAAVAAAEEAQAAGAFAEYEAEDRAYRLTLALIRKELDFGLPVRPLDRTLVPSFDFWNTAVVLVVGQDGLVANTAKYVRDLPIIGVNPDPTRYDGVLLPFQPTEARAAVQRVLAGRAETQSVTLAEVNLGNGQRMLAFNDFFIGCASHASARYTLEVGGRCEPQSSSGVLVSTGAGATGWLSSVFNMAEGVWRLIQGRGDGQTNEGRADRAVGDGGPHGSAVEGGAVGTSPVARARAPFLQRSERRLAWAVREPFISKQSGATLVAGILGEGEELVLESLMPQRGIIFSDGIEDDFLDFNSGTIARVGVSAQSANLVVKGS